MIAWSAIKELENKDFVDQIIWYNSAIKVQGKPVLFKKAFISGLIHVKQLCNSDHYLLTTQEIVNTFDITIMQCNSLTADISKHFKANTKSQQSFEPTMYEKLINAKKIVAKAYEMLIQGSGPLQHTLQKWYKKVQDGCKLEISEYSEMLGNIYKVTNNSKLRSFQYRILHSAIILNTHLYKWNIKKSPKCYFCEIENETILHILVDCPQVKAIWLEVENICKQLNSCDDIKIDTWNILYNCINPNPFHVFNLICLITKQYIYATKCLGKRLNAYELKSKIVRIKSYELFKAKQTKKVIKHCKKWFIQYETIDGADDTNIIIKHS